MYNDKFETSKQEYLGKNGESDDDGNRLVKNMETNGRFHSDWLSMMYPRLIKARNLLSDDGVIFISIGEEELYNLKTIADEVFGEKNFIANLIWQSTPGSNTGDGVKIVTENILLYTKNANECVFNNLQIYDSEKYASKDEFFAKRGGYVLNKLDRRMTGQHYSDALNYQIEMPDKTLLFPGNSTSKQEHWNWRWSFSKVKWGVEHGFIVMKKNDNGWSVYFKQYERVDNEDKPIVRTVPRQNLLNIDGANSARGTREVMSLFDGKLFDYPKPLNLMTYIQRMTTSESDVVMDFFSGSATTAHAVMQLNAEDGGNRKYIMIQLQEPCEEKSEAFKAGYKNICEIGKERIRRANKKIEENLKNEISTQESIIISSEENIEKTIEEIAKKQDDLNKIKQGALDESLVKDNKKLEKLENEVQNLNEKIQRLEETIENAKETKEQKEKILANMDFGFRVLRLDSSNMKDVFYRPRDLKKDDLLSYASNIKEGRTELDLLFQAMPEIAGADYNAKIEEISISGKKVFKVNNNYIVACFEENINEEVIREIAKMKPIYAVFRDGSFSDDSLLSNLEQIFGFESPDTELKIL